MNENGRRKKKNKNKTFFFLRSQPRTWKQHEGGKSRRASGWRWWCWWVAGSKGAFTHGRRSEQSGALLRRLVDQIKKKIIKEEEKEDKNDVSGASKSSPPFLLLLSPSVDPGDGRTIDGADSGGKMGRKKVRARATRPSACGRWR